ncbi:type II toxin-antitoxin system ParD family antitoxin [Caldimonas tepidiphila]|uniref:type II toxin-antitoxin system ParD family antitoxin n=1 Tax=Caldimonas tepidiphila TaxID=2315841 RepID=UPI003012C5C5
MNISLPDSLETFVNQQVDQGGYGSSSEYLCELIRNDQESKKRRQQMHELLLSPAAPARSLPPDVAYFEALRERFRKAASAGRPGEGRDGA